MKIIKISSLAGLALSIALSVHAQVTPPSDSLTIFNAAGQAALPPLVLSEANEPIATVMSYTSAQLNALVGGQMFLNVTGGVTVVVEPGTNGALLLNQTLTLLPSLTNPLVGDINRTVSALFTQLGIPLSQISDVFGIASASVIPGTQLADVTTFTFGFLSDNETGLGINTFGVPGQLLNFALEDGGPISGNNYIAAQFRVNGANGFSAQFFSDTGDARNVPDSGMTVSLLGLGLTGLALLRRKLA